jgi:hypothetical protein
MASAELDGKTGFVSAGGLWVIPPEFDKCYRFFGSLAAARSGDSYCYLRRNGEVVWTSEPGAMVQAPPVVA